MIYVAFYLWIFIQALILEIKLSLELRLIFFSFLTICLVIFAGLRGNIEPDYSNYQAIFFSSNQGNSFGVEYGYYLINKFFLFLGLGFQSVVFVMAAFTIVPKLVFFEKYSPNYAFSFLIFFSSVFILFDFIAIRQALAITLFMVSIPYLIKRQFLIYFSIILLATTIHLTAALLLPLYFFTHREYNRYLLYIVVLVCSAINILKIVVPFLDFIINSFPIPEIAAVKIFAYSNEDAFAFVTVKQCILGFLFIFIRNNNNLKDSKEVNLFVNLFVFGIFIATLFNGIPQFSYRIKWYFFWTESILVVYLIKEICFKNIWVTYILYILFSILYAISFFTLLGEISGREDYYIYPYKLFFDLNEKSAYLF